MPLSNDLTSVGDDLADALRERHQGSVVVEDVIVDVGEDRDGVLSINLTAVLKDPGPGLVTWPQEDLLPSLSVSMT